MYELLINCDEMDDGQASVRYGLALAASLQAFATGLHVVPVDPILMAAPDPMLVPDALAILDVDEHDARAYAGNWQRLCAAASVQGTWDVVRGPYVPVLATRSRMADLWIAPLPVAEAGRPLGWDNVTRTLFAGASPTLLVPADWQGAAPPQRVLLAWNGSAEAMQAIRAALPLLRTAEQVHLFDGQEALLPGLEAPPLPLRDWLTRQGVAVQQRQVVHAGRHTGELLLEEAEAMHADLLVMGAWGHSRLSELVLGGVTHHVLGHARLPLLLAR